MDMLTVARILKGKHAHPDVSLVIAPGSRQVLQMLAREGALVDLLESGARLMESACGFCIGMGQSPQTDAVSLRTNNRNFEGRSGTRSAQVYLVSPEAAAAAAITGVVTDPRDLEMDYPDIEMPEQFLIDDSMFARRGPQIRRSRSPRAQHRRSAAQRAAAGGHRGRGDDQGGGQDHDRPHYRRPEPY